MALPLGWLLGIATWRWYSNKHARASLPDRRLILGLALAGPLLHLLLDFGNNYGIHPFWPLSGKWIYGDTIFIVEPLWLAVLVPILAQGLLRRWLKLLLWAVLSAVLLACWFVPFVSTISCLVVLGLTMLAFAVARFADERRRVNFAILACLAVALVFALAARRAKAELRAAAKVAFPALEIDDVATTPLPANPACWEGFVAGEQGGNYRVMRATVALGPVEAARCGAGTDVEPTAPVVGIDHASYGGVRWLTEYHVEVSTLARLRRDDCRFRALLQFARLPYLASRSLVAGDLRYDRKPSLDFADVELLPRTGAGPCPRFLPGWVEPRAALFQR